MPAPVSAFQSMDGTLFLDRKEAEAHDLMCALREKFGEEEAIKLHVIVEQREWFENLFTSVKKDQPRLAAVA